VAKEFRGKEIILPGKLSKIKTVFGGGRKPKAKRQKTLERELEWRGWVDQKAGHAKGKARIANYDKLASEETKEREERLEFTLVRAGET